MQRKREKENEVAIGTRANVKTKKNMLVINVEPKTYQIYLRVCALVLN